MLNTKESEFGEIHQYSSYILEEVNFSMFAVLKNHNQFSAWKCSLHGSHRQGWTRCGPDSLPTSWKPQCALLLLLLIHSLVNIC
jgi:hypothetical protein